MSLQTILTDAPIAEDVKAELLERLDAEGATPDVVAAIKSALQEYIDAGFKTLGIELDPNDPKVQAAQKQFDDDVAAAEAEYTEEMENLAIDAAVVQVQGNKALDGLQASALTSALKAQLAA